MPRGTQVIHGTEYVFETKAKWNAQKKYGTHTRTYIGKMIDGAFVPNKRYVLQGALEDAQHKNPGPVPVTACSRLFCGTTALFDGIGDKLGITEDLKQCFPDTWRQILSIAYFLILEDRNPLSRFPRWAAHHRHPFGKNIPSQRSSDLFGSIGEDAKQRFFRLQTKRRLETEYLVYDTTSISSYSTMITQVRYGKNKDHEQLPQINLALVYGESSQLPVYYRKLPGNIPDVATVKRLLADLAFLSFDKVKLVMDRGFYSEDTINELFQKHYKFLIAAKKSLRLVRSVLDEVRDSMRTRVHYNSNFKLNYYSRTVNWEYKETKKRSGTVETADRRLYLHLYYDDQRALDDKQAFNALLDTLEAELLEGRRTPDHEKLYQKYYDVTETPVRGVTLIPKQDAIDQVERDYGYFALMSNDIKDPIEALIRYRCKDLIEKTFGNLKERLNLRRTSVSSEEHLEGKLFVEFVALMYLSSINKGMNEQGLYKHYTLHELLDDLDVIECFEQPGHSASVGEITQKQKDLYAAFGVAVPS